MSIAIHTERLLLSKFQAADFSDYLRLVQNLDVMRYITEKELSQEEAQNNFKKILRINQQYPKIGVFAARHQSDHAFYGLGKLVPLENEGLEIGYSLLPEYWGKRYATEMVEHLIRFARETTDFQNLVGIIDPLNAPSKKILTNFRFEFYKKGKVYDLPADYYRLELPPSE